MVQLCNCARPPAHLARPKYPHALHWAAGGQTGRDDDDDDVDPRTLAQAAARLAKYTSEEVRGCQPASPERGARTPHKERGVASAMGGGMAPSPMLSGKMAAIGSLPPPPLPPSCCFPQVQGPLPEQQWADLYQEGGPLDVAEGGQTEAPCDFVVAQLGGQQQQQHEQEGPPRGVEEEWVLSCGPHKVRA